MCASAISFLPCSKTKPRRMPTTPANLQEKFENVPPQDSPHTKHNPGVTNPHSSACANLTNPWHNEVLLLTVKLAGFAHESPRPSTRPTERHKAKKRTSQHKLHLQQPIADNHQTRVDAAFAKDLPISCATPIHATQDSRRRHFQNTASLQVDCEHIVRFAGATSYEQPHTMFVWTNFAYHHAVARALIVKRIP